METKKQDEPKSEEPEEKKPVLEEARELKEELDKVLAEAKELRAEAIMNGKADAGQVQEKPQEESAEDYSKSLLEGNVQPEA